MKHLKEVLNRTAPEEELDVTEAGNDVSVDTGLSKREGITAASKSL